MKIPLNCIKTYFCSKNKEYEIGVSNRKKDRDERHKKGVKTERGISITQGAELTSSSKELNQWN